MYSRLVGIGKTVANAIGHDPAGLVEKTGAREQLFLGWHRARSLDSVAIDLGRQGSDLRPPHVGVSCGGRIGTATALRWLVCGAHVSFPNHLHQHPLWPPA